MCADVISAAPQLDVEVEGVDEERAYLQRFQAQLAEADEEQAEMLESRISMLRHNILKRKADAYLEWPCFKWAGREATGRGWFGERDV